MGHVTITRPSHACRCPQVLCVLDMLAQWDAIRVPQEGRDQGNVQEAVPEGGAKSVRSRWSLLLWT